MELLVRTYRLFNLLSLDVASGALISALFFARILNVTLLPYGMSSLFLTVWIIYTVDHLLDARRIKGVASSARHRFHQRYAGILLLCIACALVVDLACLLFIRKSLLMYGIILGAACVVYLALHHRIYRWKELIIAFFYTIGITIPAVAAAPHKVFVPELVLPASCFFLLALSNLYLFSLYDADEDSRDKLHSATLWMSDTTLLRLIVFLLLALVVLVIVYYLVVDNSMAVITILLMAAGLAILLSNRPAFKRQAYYRWIGDGVFFLPLFYLLF